MNNSLSPLLHEIIKCCFPEFEHTELIFAIAQNLTTERSSDDTPFSLMRFTVKEHLKQALQEEEIVKEINEIITTNPLDLSHLQLFEGKLELLKAAFEMSYRRSDGFLGLDVRSSTCRLTAERRHIAEFPIAEKFEELKNYVNLAIERRFKRFRISVAEQPIGQETRRAKLERIAKEIEQEDFRSADGCSISCYIQRGFHFGKFIGSHIYFTKYVGNDGICRHVANKVFSRAHQTFNTFG